MKIVANDYDAKDIMRIMREWTELKQPEFSKMINRGIRSLQAYESRETWYSVDMLLDIAKKNGIIITLEKK